MSYDINAYLNRNAKAIGDGWSFSYSTSNDYISFSLKKKHEKVGTINLTHEDIQTLIRELTKFDELIMPEECEKDFTDKDFSIVLYADNTIALYEGSDFIKLLEFHSSHDMDLWIRDFNAGLISF